jgi:hypothetical protein
MKNDGEKKDVSLGVSFLEGCTQMMGRFTARMFAKHKRRLETKPHFFYDKHQCNPSIQSFDRRWSLLGQLVGIPAFNGVYGTAMV